MKLFQKFDKTYLMNLKKRPDRLEHFKNQVNKFDLGEYEYFEAINGKEINNPSKFLKPGESGHVLSTIGILENAIKNNYTTILLVEDDCVFLDEIKNIDSYFKLIPENWDMLYFGGNHNTHMNASPPIKINENIVKLHYTFSSHCLALNKKMFPIILSELKKFINQTDVIYQKLQRQYNAYCFNPILATQLTGFSDIQNRNIDYSFLIK